MWQRANRNSVTYASLVELCSSLRKLQVYYYGKRMEFSKKIEKMQVEEKRHIMTKRIFHFKIKIDKEFYFFIVKVETSIMFSGNIITIKRGSCFWDCGKPLNKSQKKQLKRMIELMF